MVNEPFNETQFCDFGSAIFETKTWIDVILGLFSIRILLTV